MTQALRNIPFYWTAIAHWLSVLLVATLLTRRWDWMRTALTAAGALAVLLGCMYVTEPLHGGAFNLMMGCFALLTAGALGLLCRVSLRQLLYYSAHSFILGGFTASFSWQIYIYAFQKLPALRWTGAEVLMILPEMAAIWLLMWLILRRQRRVTPLVHITWASAVSTAAMGLVIYIVSSLSYVPFDSPFRGSTDFEAFNIRTLVYFGGVAMLYAMHLQLCESYVLRERDALESMLTMQYKSYQLGQESVDLINRKYHDLKHQITLLRSEIGTDQKLEVLDQLEREIRVYETQNKTGNQILDTILTSKGIHCQQEDIKLTCVADGKALDFMEMADISVLFGNALDNAIEAVGRIPDPDQRLIHLTVSQHLGFLRIQVENRYTGGLRIHNGLPLTTKADSRFHGYGIKSIQATVEKYSGSVTFQGTDGWFELRVLIPVPQNT